MDSKGCDDCMREGKTLFLKAEDGAGLTTNGKISGRIIRHTIIVPGRLLCRESEIETELLHPHEVLVDGASSGSAKANSVGST